MKKLIMIKAYEIVFSFFNHIKDKIEKRLFRLNIMSSENSLQYLLNNLCSIARYGDGELDYLFQKRDVGFQKTSVQLQERLIEVIKHPPDGLLVCMPRPINTVRNQSRYSKEYWTNWCKNGHKKEVVMLVKHLAPKHYIFGNTQLSRPYMDYKSPKNAEKLFPLLKKLWDDRDIIIVEGSQTRMGIGNDLFDNAKSIKRIICPAVNAFESYDEILSSILELYQRELIIIALGPTATVLASDLAKKGIQALDLGHLDVEYEWYLQGAKEKVPLKGKYVNEAGEEGRQMSECEAPTYISQIIKIIK